METYPLPERPEEAIHLLISALKKSGELRHFASGAHIPVQPDNIIVIEQGSLSMHRVMDSLMMIESTRPQLLGITYNNQFSRHFMIKAESACEARIVPRGEFEAIIEARQLWRELLLVVSWYYDVLYWKSYHYLGRQSYTLIRNCLIELAAKDEQERDEINACDFIRGKTNLSQSYILKVFSDLRKGDYIDISRGRLKSINKLPERY
ncbi:helix-turn-helix domain-containing protein [Cronobacter malonaticus]|uniref:helix-turn-helix domain-containing protein n=1 Tax=Cronobacter malonaticus TaxID=413503 RepID=UPI000CFDC955|nr:helix-turn-helix domain-containing protein [Cronobacter malonaticus]EKY3230573.1 helix-turn-helix domain-containing protein [Cronobacter malonaticus]ELY4023766.1 helix-turn-helix domain-containing protein [Cronobacter malonaticus]ELY5851728.1 helix-turn-helix domain-containing protein [Cronobacter malonaticus]MDI6460458.1 helix-turn-helix domain-containing protein [Cronobacter malonaticus]MDI7686298.1 helix-turn-helix domain-containing protein [Cronobacter malonaticus]